MVVRSKYVVMDGVEVFCSFSPRMKNLSIVAPSQFLSGSYGHKKKKVVLVVNCIQKLKEAVFIYKTPRSTGATAPMVPACVC